MNEQLKHLSDRVAAGKMNRREFIGKATALDESTVIGGWIEDLNFGMMNGLAPQKCWLTA